MDFYLKSEDIDYRMYSKEMKKVAQANGAHFVILNWRWTNNKYDENFFSDINVNVIDTLEGAPPDWYKMVVFGGVHPNAEAGNHVAQLLLKYLRSKDLIKDF